MKPCPTSAMEPPLPTRDVLSESAQLTRIWEKISNFLNFSVKFDYITEKPGHMLFQTFGLVEDELLRNTSQVS